MANILTPKGMKSVLSGLIDENITPERQQLLDSISGNYESTFNELSQYMQNRDVLTDEANEIDYVGVSVPSENWEQKYNELHATYVATFQGVNNQVIENGGSSSQEEEETVTESIDDFLNNFVEREEE